MCLKAILHAFSLNGPVSQNNTEQRLCHLLKMMILGGGVVYKVPVSASFILFLSKLFSSSECGSAVVSVVYEACV